jgi:hypothetical protein
MLIYKYIRVLFAVFGVFLTCMITKHHIENYKLAFVDGYMERQARKDRINNKRERYYSSLKDVTNMSQNTTEV